MATYNAGDQINRALRMLGVLAEGETPSASTSADALMAFNQMIDSWSIESLSVYSTTTITVTWPAGQAVQTLGPSGSLGVTIRPAMIDDSSYFTVNGVDYTLQIVSDAEYNAIPVKSTLSSIPMVLLVNPTYPDVELTLYPVPSQATAIHFVSGTVLSQPATLATVLAFPPGYLRAFASNLALEIAPEFGVDPAKDIRRIAMISKRNIKRINSPIDVMRMPDNLVIGRSRANIITGY